MCDVSAFDPKTVVRVVDYIYGEQKPDATAGSLSMQPGPQVGSTAKAGDGTVPDYSAQNKLVSESEQTMQIDASHMGIISRPDVLALVDRWYSADLQHALLRLGRDSPQYAELLSEQVALSGELLAIPANPKKWDEPDGKFAIEINGRALGLAGVPVENMAGLAAATVDPVERAKLFTVAAAISTEPRAKAKWLTESAKATYVASAAGRAGVLPAFADAIESAQAARDFAATAFPVKDALGAQLTAQSVDVDAWSNLRLGKADKFTPSSPASALKEPSFAIARAAFRLPNLDRQRAVPDLRVSYHPTRLQFQSPRRYTRLGC
jgi:hypothetical protein